jgi:hypothetical protein
MDVAMAAGTVSSVIFAASNVPMLVKARRTRDVSSYSLSNLVLNNVGNLLYCLYVYNLPLGPIWAMQSFYLLTMALLLCWYLRFRPPRRARLAQPASAAPTRSPENPAGRGRGAPAQRARPPVTDLRCHGPRSPPRINRSAARGMSNSRSWHRHPRDRTTARVATAS